MLEPVWRFISDWVVKIRAREERERQAATALTTICCGGKFIEVADRPKDPLENRALLAELWSRPDHVRFECGTCRKTADLKAAADAYLATHSAPAVPG